MAMHTDKPLTELLQLVSFKLGESWFGVDILHVREIVRPGTLSRVPGTKPFVEGVFNLRGEIVPVLNLRKRFGLPQKDADKFTRIIIFDLHGLLSGALVDSTAEVLRIPASLVEPTPPSLSGVDTAYISGVARLDERVLILLNLEKLLEGGGAFESVSQ